LDEFGVFTSDNFGVLNFEDLGVLESLISMILES